MIDDGTCDEPCEWVPSCSNDGDDCNCAEGCSWDLQNNEV